MKSTGFRRRAINLVGLTTLLSLLGIFAVLFPQSAASQDEPTPRPTPTTAPYIVLEPTQAVGEETVYITVYGYLWPTDGSTVGLFWDDLVHFLDGPIAIDGSTGEFETIVEVPAPWATPGTHQVIAAIDSSYSTFADINLVVPTPTNTPTASLTPSPTVPTNTPTVTDTPGPTSTTGPTATMRPVTPIVTGYPAYPTSQPYYYPTSVVTRYPLPTNTRRPQPTTVPPTRTPTPTPTDTPTLTPSPTPTDTPTLTPSPTPTDTPTLTPTATPTDTPTSTATPTATPLPGAPDASAPSAGAGLPASGGSWESVFLQGFVAAVLLVVLLTAFIIVVLVILLVLWRMMRMRRAEGQV